MSFSKYANRIDANQPEIVKSLRSIPGVTVKPDHDDIIVGYQGRTYWFEIKDPKKTLNKNGTVKPNAIKPSQVDMLNEYTGHYAIVWSLDDILDELGIKPNPDKLCGLCWLNSDDGSPICKCEV